MNGSNVTDLVDSDDGLEAPQGLTIHNDQLYWTNMEGKLQRAGLNLGSGTSDFTLQIGANNSTDDRMIFGIDSVTTDSLLLADTDVDTLSNTQTTINSLDAAIDFINDQRSNLGAVQNRLGFADSNLMSSIQNTESSLSTIRDADFALEASNLAHTQILTQSGTAMLAQANQISQNILSLLK
jgi:flagellin